MFFDDEFVRGVEDRRRRRRRRLVCQCFEVRGVRDDRDCDFDDVRGIRERRRCDFDF